jgi:hypothetical protein
VWGLRIRLSDLIFMVEGVGYMVLDVGFGV